MALPSSTSLPVIAPYRPPPMVLQRQSSDSNVIQQHPRQESGSSEDEEGIFLDLMPMLRKFVSGERLLAVMERRSNKYGVPNYGEIRGFKNPSDGDCWDIFVPGYDTPLPCYQSFGVERLLGVVMVPNGNHKLAVRLCAPQLPDGIVFQEDLVERQVQRFVRRYSKKHRYHCRWVCAREFWHEDHVFPFFQRMFSSYSNNGTWGERGKNIFL
jgi:hypothetical protein